MNIPFSDSLPLTPLHWHIADQTCSVALENTRDGLQLYDNPVGVLTNNPAFSFQLTNLSQYMNLISGYPKNCFSDLKGIAPFGQGLGSFGLPGDYSPASRFVKSAWLLLNSVCDKDDPGSLSQFFHLLDSVSVVKGSVLSRQEECDMTTYACCINATRGVYYYKTYGNSQFTAVNLRHENLESSALRIFPLIVSQQIAWANVKILFQPGNHLHQRRQNRFRQLLKLFSRNLHIWYAEHRDTGSMRSLYPGLAVFEHQTVSRRFPRLFHTLFKKMSGQGFPLFTSGPNTIPSKK